MYVSGHEIIRIAISIEENGHVFYTEGSKTIKDNESIKKLFLELAEKELSHIAIFQRLYDQFEAEKFEFKPDEAGDYIQHLAASHIFGKPDSGKEMAKTVHSAGKALDIAIQFEKDSVAFYMEMAKRTETDALKMVNQIIEEEKEHVRELETFL